jgi:mRNA-degrading endonuclease toxin of MazEF toxin-antitoxin module/Arc/MetJ-type ribon-helix-helix transcriptional regulator
VRHSNHRRKVSTTISPEAYEFLRRLVESGRAATLAEAVDQVVRRARRTENRSRLEQATAAYFARLSRAAAQEEKSWGSPWGNQRMRFALTIDGAVMLPSPRRGEIWSADLGSPSTRHWVLIVSLDSRNQSESVDTVLVVPFGSRGAEGPTTLLLPPGETGLPVASWLEGHFVTTLPKARLRSRAPRGANAASALDHPPRLRSRRAVGGLKARVAVTFGIASHTKRQSFRWN